jgi:hypothetical protein
MAKTKIAVGNLGAEESAQFIHKVMTRAATRAQADELFEHKATGIAAANQARLKELFVQAPAAETMAPSLAKTAAVDTFFDKLAELSMTDAQRRYPELLKVAGPLTTPSPTLKRAKSATAVTSTLAGGAS